MYLSMTLLLYVFIQLILILVATGERVVHGKPLDHERLYWRPFGPCIGSRYKEIPIYINYEWNNIK